MTSFWQELRRRNVVKVGIAYAVLAWLIIQIASDFFPALGIPRWALTLVAAMILIGFPIALLLAWVYEITPQGVKRTDEVSAAASIAHVTGHRLNYVVIGLLVVAVALLALDNFSDGRHTATPSAAVPSPDAPDANAAGAGPAETLAPGVTNASPERAATRSAQPSIAVLNFVNGSPDPDQDYFVAGLSEQLRDTLGRIQGLAVVGSTSSTYFEGRDADLRTIGEALNVGHVLEGSIRKAGEDLRISARLTEAATGYQIWSATYERTLDDIFELQDEIAGAVAEALQVTLGVGAIGRLAGMTRNVEAYETFVTALGLWRDFRPESLRNAVEYAKRAIAIDPSFALAWLVLAGIYSDGALVVPVEAGEWRREAAAALARATELTPSAPRVLLAQGWNATQRGRFLEAGRFFEEQLPALASEYESYGVAASARGRFLLNVGRVEDAIRDLERARAAEPLSGIVSLFLADAYAAAGAFEAAFAEYDRGVEIGEFPVFVNGSALLAALASGDAGEIERRLPRVNDEITSRIAPLMDEPASALAYLRSVTSAVSATDEPLLYAIAAQWVAYFGDPETALELLRELATVESERDAVTTTIVRPLLRNVRALPEFEQLVQEVGLVDYWRAYGWSDYCRPVGDRDFACE